LFIINFNTDEGELKIVLKSMSKNKALGLDETCVQLLEIYELSSIYLKICNYTLRNGKPPSEWLISLLIPIHKKGDKSDCNNYRGIALMSIAAKVFNKMLLNRIRDILDSHLRKNQNGFRSSRSTTQQILAMRRLIEMCRVKQNLNLVAVFIDFSKAFDSISWNSIEQILLAYDIPPLIVSAVMVLYRGAQAQVSTDDGVSDPTSWLLISLLFFLNIISSISTSLPNISTNDRFF